MFCYKLFSFQWEAKNKGVRIKYISVSIFIGLCPPYEIASCSM